MLLAALVRTIAEWTGGDSALVELEGHGREPLFDDVDVSRTVGWFTSVLPVRLRLATGDWGAQLKATKEQLRAVPRHGIGHGLARYLRADTAGALAATPAPQLSFNYLGRLDQQRGSAGGRFTDRVESLGPNQDPHGERPHLIGVTAFVSANSLRVSWSYSANRHTAETVRLLARHYLSHLTALIGHCRSDAAGGATPSDFPLAGLDQRTLDLLLAQLPGGARGVEDVYPLSPLQSGMLFRSMFDPESDDYFEQTGLILHGELDVDVLAAQWQRVVDRHAVLRTIFRWHDLPHPLQVVRGATGRSPATGLDRDRSRAELHERLEQDCASSAGFASTSPLTARTGSPSSTRRRRTLLLWSLHHILLDAWSVAALLDEVLTPTRRARGRPVEPPTVTPFRDYIAWIGSQNRMADEDFWRAELAGLTEPTLLSPESADPGSGGVDHIHRELSADLVAGLQGSGRWQQVHRRHRATDGLGIAVGRPHRSRRRRVRHRGRRPVGGRHRHRPHGRHADQHAAHQGHRRSGPARADHLADRQARKLELREHEHCALTDIQRHAADTGGAPMFDTYFSYENFAGRDIGGGGLVAGPLRRDFEQTDCPLMFEVNHHDTIQIRTIYRRSIFDEPACLRILQDYEGILRALVDRPQAPLGQLPALTTARRATPDGPRVDSRAERIVTYVPPRDDVERAIAETWTTVLGVPRVGVHDDYFELGGDSILAIQIVRTPGGRACR